MLNFKFANEDNLNEIKNIWKTCFLEPINNAEFFLSRNFTTTNCAVCCIDNKIVSMLFLLDIQLYTEFGLQNANYIYAAATLPEFRKQGLMGKLLDFSNNESLKRGNIYSILLPANSKLYNFYEKYGYKKFFKINNLKISQEEIKSLINGQCPSEIDYSLNNIDKIYFLRQKFLKTNGNVVLSKHFLKYAIDMNKFYGGKTFCSQDEYAIVRNTSMNTEILEICCKKENLPSLLASIHSEFKSSSYIIRLPGNTHYFPSKETLIDFGMIKPLTPDKNNLSNILKKNPSPYLGLALD